MHKPLERDHDWLWFGCKILYLHGSTRWVALNLLENCLSSCLMLLALERTLSRVTKIRSNETTTADNILRLLTHDDTQLFQCNSLFEVLLLKTRTLPLLNMCSKMLLVVAPCSTQALWAHDPRGKFCLRGRLRNRINAKSVPSSAEVFPIWAIPRLGPVDAF